VGVGGLVGDGGAFFYSLANILSSAGNPADDSFFFAMDLIFNPHYPHYCIIYITLMFRKSESNTNNVSGGSGGGVKLSPHYPH